MSDPTEVKSPWDMSDEEILAATFMDDSGEPEADADPEPTEDDADAKEQESEEDPEESEEAGTEGKEGEGAGEDSDPEADADPDLDAEEDDAEGKESDEGIDLDKDNADGGEPDKKDKVPKAKADKDESGDIDYKAFYEQMTATFKANGKEMTVKDAKDLIHLKEMGANYSQKMAGLKPALRTMQMLENNGLMDEKKLSYLIDLSKGDKTAIAKLIKDHGVDPLDIDVKKDSGYKQSDHSVTQDEFAIRDAFKNIEGTTSYQKTLKLVNEGLDPASRQVLLGNPDGIARFNAQVESGLYDKVMDVVNQERMLGRLKDVSDLEAYDTMGKQMQSDGRLAAASPASADVPAGKAKPKSDPERDKRRKAATKTKSTGKKANNGKPKMDFNPLDLDDKEFEKLMASGKYG